MFGRRRGGVSWPVEEATPGAGTFMLGTRHKPDDTAISYFETWLGRDVEIVDVFLGSGSDKTQAQSIAQATYVCNVYDGVRYNLDVNVPLVWSGYTLAQAATGSHDSTWDDIADELITGGRADAILRIAHEFNGDWYTWSHRNDPTNFVTAFKRCADRMRARPGANFKICWCVAHGGGSLPWNGWPGTDWVDYVGQDFYDRTFQSSQSSVAVRWSRLIDGNPPWLIPLTDVRDFAEAEGVPLAYPEWGLSLTHVQASDPDEPDIIQNVYDWMMSIQNLGYANYFEDNTGQKHRLSKNDPPTAYQDSDTPVWNGSSWTGGFPLSAVKYKATFGAL